MVRRCVIEGCESKSTLPEHQGVTYHSFPFDSKTRDVWIENCRIPTDKNITKNILVCSRHFRRADFQPMKSGKYLLKNGASPSVFPWGKSDSSSSSLESAPVSRVNSVVTENATASSVEATIAQIMAETAELNRAAGITAKDSKRKISRSEDSSLGSPSSQSNTPLKMEMPTTFTPGIRLEIQEINGQWHSGKVVEVDNDDREVLIKFEKSGKSKRAESEEWIPMNSPRLRQKSFTKLVPTFTVNEKCFARWTGSRKFPATVQKVLPEDFYEVLFEDGFIKTVRGGHMSKVKSVAEKLSSPNSVGRPPKTPKTKTDLSCEIESPISDGSTKKSKSRKNHRKDWPLISMDTLDLDSLNLPKVPKDGEWTCHWVNDQPIGQEGFLLIGEHKKPTVIVDDWRLPEGWVKHMYQRSNVLGKWDVILVNPSGKRFRSKADLKQALEDAGQVYNPDIYDFSIHRRRAKDINAYVYTADYTPPPKPISLSNSPQDSCAVSSNFSSSSFPPAVTPLPPMELMTPPPPPKTTTKTKESAEPKVKDNASSRAEEVTSPILHPIEDGYVYIGGLKVQIVDNLFRCPQEGCCKNFRKENHLLIHIKHYHQDLIKHLSSCPNMQDLALKRTIGHPDSEPHPRNQIPNQQFFAKMHQQDIQHSRGHRKSVYPNTPVLRLSSPIHTTTTDDNSCLSPAPVSTDESMDISTSKNNTTLETSFIGSEATLVTADTSVIPKLSTLPSTTSTVAAESFEPISNNTPVVPVEAKKSKMSFIKKSSHTGARKSNRQRTTKKYLTGAHTTPGPALVPPFEGSFGGNDFEETRDSFNATPDKPAPPKKPKLLPVVANDSTNTADGSVTTSSFPDPSDSPKYIKENGELIKIVRMKQEEIINCLCSYGEEDGLMIQCELCLCWQHGSCNGIDKESDVPDKYVCYICRNPQRGRESRKYIHDQDWMYEGKLPAANYHEENPMHPERFEILKKSHTLSGNLIELKRFLHSLQVKINIAENKDHPKMYLWEKRWDPILKDVIKTESATIKTEDVGVELKDVHKDEKPILDNQGKVKTEPHIPQPEAPIDPVECQHRLLEHIKVQQGLVMNRLDDIEAEVNELEGIDNLIDLKSSNLEETKDVLSSFIKDLETMKTISKINALANMRNNNLVIIK